MIVTEEVYLEHHGVRGMRWGIRNKSVSVGGKIGRATSKGRVQKGDWASRSRKQKAALVAGGIGGYVIGRHVAATIMRHHAPLTQAALGGASGVAGARITRAFLDRNKNKAPSEVPNFKKHNPKAA